MSIIKRDVGSMDSFRSTEFQAIFIFHVMDMEASFTD